MLQFAAILLSMFQLARFSSLNVLSSHVYRIVDVFKQVLHRCLSASFLSRHALAQFYQSGPSRSVSLISATTREKKEGSEEKKAIKNKNKKNKMCVLIIFSHTHTHTRTAGWLSPDLHPLTSIMICCPRRLAPSARLMCRSTGMNYTCVCSRVRPPLCLEGDCDGGCLFAGGFKGPALQKRLF